MVMCWAYGCNHYSDRGATCKFFRFPMKMMERKRWIRLLRRTTEPGPTTYVCSCHFREGKKENGSELCSFNVEKRSSFDVAEPEPKPKRIRKHKLPEISSTLMDPGPSTSAAPSTFSAPSTSAADETSIVEKVIPIETTGSALMEAENYYLKQQVEELQERLTYVSARFCYENIQANDKLIILYTGLPNSKIFEALFTLIKNIPLNYYMGWKVHKKVKLIDQLLLSLMKLRLNVPHLDLATRFGISQGSVTNIFLTFVHVIHGILYKQLMANIPTRYKNKMCLPNCFSSFTDCRAVIDCTEIFTVVARKSMSVQRATYSHYKHHNTLKGLVGVAPNGVVTYVSDLYAGSTSDKKIVQDCGILSKLEVGDLILADKGFLIQDILPHGVSLNIPPFLRTPQFTPAQIRQTKTIARARIHVERAIRRMKCFRILQLMPESLCPYGNVIFTAVAALTNLQYPLIKEVDQLFADDD